VARRRKIHAPLLLTRLSADAKGVQGKGQSQTKSLMSQSFLIELREKVKQSTDHTELLRTLIERNNREPFFSCESDEFADRMEKLIQAMGGDIEDSKKEHDAEARKAAWKKRLSTLKQEWKDLEDNEWT